jgi:hypothetical protein
MPLWLTLIVVGIVVAIVGFAGVGHWLIILGVIVLVVGAIMTLVSSRGSRV